MGIKQSVVLLLRLIRIPNIIMMVLSLYLVRYMVIEPFLSYNSLYPSLINLHFRMIVIAVVLIAAGGNIINDLCDVGTDIINKGKNIPALLIDNNILRVVYYSITILGVLTGSIATILNGSSFGSALFIFCAGLLYFYSISYKRNLIIGNLIVALLTAIMIYLPVIFDRNAYASEHISIIVISYSIFAFMISFSREIVKDCQDLNGDKQAGYKTLPIVAGERTARKIAGVILLSLVTGIGIIQIMQNQWESLIPFLYILIFVQFPLIYISYRLLLNNISVNRNKTDSFLLKGVMVTGLLSMVIFHYYS